MTLRLLWAMAALCVACGDPPLAASAASKADGSAADGAANLDGAGRAGDAGADAGADTVVPADLGADAVPTADADAVADAVAVADAAAAADAVAVADADAAGDAAPDAVAPPKTVYAGHCGTPFVLPAKQKWTHDFVSPTVILAGKPNHRIRDLILPIGTASKLRGHFTYGIADVSLGDETVELWVQTCPGWVSWGKKQTGNGATDNGIVFFDVPADVPPGDYQVKIVMLGDQTVADGAIAIWPKGVQTIVTDVDGTLTTSDWQLISDVIFGADAEMYPDANTVMNQWAKKDFRLIYLTGRPQIVNRYTRTWLANHGFPAGTLHLTEDVGQLIPNDTGVQKFKTDFLAGVQKDVAPVIKPAYGNAPTDIGAYAAVGIAKAVTWIIGPNAGNDGTQALTSYTSHLPGVLSAPVANQP